MCYVTNTAEYCVETVPQLEGSIKQKIDAAYGDAIDLSGEVDAFHDVAATAVKCLVSGLEVRAVLCCAVLCLPFWRRFGDCVAGWLAPRP